MIRPRPLAALLLGVLAGAPVAVQSGEGHALRFYGNNLGDIDRVKIRIDDMNNELPGPPADVGAEDFTIEFWMKATAAENPRPAINCGPTIGWVFGNIILDRDRFDADRKFGVSIAGGVVVFGVTGIGTSSRYSLCGTTNVLDDRWHHVAVQRRRSDGWMWIYVDGLLEAEVNGPNGDISYPDDAVPSNLCGGPCLNDQYLVIGQEKADQGDLHYSGYLDELRLSNTIRYAASFTPPERPFVRDTHTMALFHLDEGTGLVAGDSAGAPAVPNECCPRDGEIKVGGSPPGPEWTTTVPCFADRFETDDACLSSTSALRDSEIENRNFCDDDEDWLVFNACAGRPYVIRTANLGPGADTVLELYAPDCATLEAFNDDSGLGPHSRIDWTAAIDGTHHVRVRQADGTTGQGRGYDVTVEGDTSSCANWATTIGGVRGEEGLGIAQVSDGGLAFAGASRSFTTSDEDGWVVKLGPSGAIDWQSRYGSGMDDRIHDIRYTADGGLVLGGAIRSFGAGGTDAWVAKLDAAGDVEWQRSLGGALDDSAAAVRQVPGGGYIVAGSTASFGSGGKDAWLVRLDDSGAVVWEVALGGPLDEQAEDVVGTSDGFVFVGATESTGAGGADTWLVRLDDSGAILWQRTYGGALTDRGHAIVMTADADFVVAGETASFGAGASDFWVVKLDPWGVVVWERAYGGTLHDVASAIGTGPAGGVVVAGETGSFGGSRDGWVLRLAPDGAVVWQQTYGAGFADRVGSVSRLVDGGYAVVGSGVPDPLEADELRALKLAQDGRIGGACPLVGTTAVTAATSAAIVADSTLAPLVSSATVGTSGPLPVATTGLPDFECRDPRDSPPWEVSPPGARQPLEFLDEVTLRWAEAAASGASTFNLYRGDLGRVQGDDYGSCLEAGILDNSTSDGSSPTAGLVWTYLVTGENSVGEGTLGFASAGNERFPGSTCP